MSKSKVLIGVGGSGAKVLEAFAYLTAMGFPGTQLEGGQRFHLRMVDTDKENGNMDRLEKLLVLLNKESGVLTLLKGFGGEWNPGALSNEIRAKSGVSGESSSAFLWQINLTRLEDLNKMADELKEANGKKRQGYLLNALYSRNDMKVPQAEGFHARPRIGALRFEYEFDEDLSKGTEGFWNSLNNNVFMPRETQLMFTGSVFGGTGASGIPTLLKRCRDAFFADDKESSLGMTLLLPYYLFPYLEEKDTSGKKQDLADPKQFRLNSKLALLFYHESDLLDTLSNPSVNLIGQIADGNMLTAQKRQVKLAAGKKEQENPALPAELAAAVSVLDYFVNKRDPEEVKLCDTGTTRSTPLSIANDFPEGKNLETALSRLAVFTLLWKILSGRKPTESEYLIPYRDLKGIKTGSPAEWRSTLGAIDEFSECSSNWLLELDANGTDLDWYRETYNAIDSFLESNRRFEDCDILIGSKSVNLWLWDILKAESAFRRLRGEDKEYRRLLYAVMKVCCDNNKPYGVKGR